MSKRTLSFEEIEAQTALELPNREMPLVNVFVPIFISDLNVIVQVPLGVAANVCDINAAVLGGLVFDEGEAACTAESTQIPRAFIRD